MKALCLTGLLVAALAAEQAPVTPESNVKRARVTGKVLNAITGEPVRKATVRLQVASGGAGGGVNVPSGMPIAPPGMPGMQVGGRGQGANTDTNGEFAFEAVEPGNYRVVGEKTGFLRSAMGGRGASMLGSTIKVSEGGEVANVVIRMTPQGIISGRVVDEDGEPVEGAFVQVSNQQYMGGRRRLMMLGSNQTNDRGEFRINNISPGRYYVAVQLLRQSFAAPPTTTNQKREEYAYPKLYYPGVETLDQAQRIEVAAGQEFSGVQIALKKMRVFRVRGRFDGLIVKEHNQTRMNLALRETTASADSLGFGPGGDLGRGGGSLRNDGSFELTNVLPGAYKLVISEFGRGGGKLLGSTMVNVASSDVDGVIVTPTPLVTLNGSVTVEGDASKFNLKAVRVNAVPVESFSFGMAPPVLPNEDGQFTLADLSPERHRINVTVGFGAYVKSVTVAGQDIRANGIDLAVGGGKIDVVVSTRVASLSGRVQKAGNDSASGSAILATLNAAGMPVPVPGMAQVDQSGNFSFSNLGPGEYVVLAFEEIDMMFANDPEFLKKFLDRAATVKMGEGETKSVSVKQIGYAESNPFTQQ
jgi:protocatechuate 3,4-dioxygenase beta subunit